MTIMVALRVLLGVGLMCPKMRETRKAAAEIIIGRISHETMGQPKNIARTIAPTGVADG